MRHTGILTERKWLHVEQFIAPACAAAMVGELLRGCRRRVTVGAGDECWTEYSVAAESRLGRILAGPAAMRLVAAALGPGDAYGAHLWGQTYEVGERIALHTDADGDVQLLLCLEQPPAACGGYLILRPNTAEVRLRLDPGDAVMFRATDIPHATTPSQRRKVRRLPAARSRLRFFKCDA
jgi:hypothetical protein